MTSASGYPFYEQLMFIVTYNYALVVTYGWRFDESIFVKTSLDRSRFQKASYLIVSMRIIF